MNTWNNCVKPVERGALLQKRAYKDMNWLQRAVHITLVAHLYGAVAVLAVVMPWEII